MRRSARLVVTEESAFQTIRMTVYDASVTMAIQENIVVSTIIFWTGLYKLLHNCFPFSTNRAHQKRLQDGFTPSGVYVAVNFFSPVNFYFSFVLNSLSYITTPKNKGKIKIN